MEPVGDWYEIACCGSDENLPMKLIFAVTFSISFSFLLIVIMMVILEKLGIIHIFPCEIYKQILSFIKCHQIVKDIENGNKVVPKTTANTTTNTTTNTTNTTTTNTTTTSKHDEEPCPKK